MGTCKVCGGPLPPSKGRGRPRVYCTDRCTARSKNRNLREQARRYRAMMKAGNGA